MNRATEEVITTAEASYDWTGFGTREVRVLGTDERGRVWRQVEIPQGFHGENQKARYSSGLHPSFTPEEFAKIKHLYLPETV